MDNKPDMVNHPPHYANGTKNFECIEIMEHVFGDNNTAMFCLVNAFKYIWRSGSKGEGKETEDFQKANWYLEKYLKLSSCKLCEKWNCVYFMLKDKIKDKVDTL